MTDNDHPAALEGEILDSMSLEELCRMCDAETTWVVELVEHGALDPTGTRTDTWVFHGVNIVRARRARRLSRDLGINAPGIALVLDLLEERDRLLRELKRFDPKHEIGT